MLIPICAFTLEWLQNNAVAKMPIISLFIFILVNYDYLINVIEPYLLYNLPEKLFADILYE